MHLRRSEAAASEGEKRLSTIGEDNGGKLILLVGNVGRLKEKKYFVKKPPGKNKVRICAQCHQTLLLEKSQN